MIAGAARTRLEVIAYFDEYGQLISIFPKHR
jgi:hypothetical protein